MCRHPWNADRASSRTTSFARSSALWGYLSGCGPIDAKGRHRSNSIAGGLVWLGSRSTGRWQLSFCLGHIIRSGARYLSRREWLGPYSLKRSQCSQRSRRSGSRFSLLLRGSRA